MSRTSVIAILAVVLAFLVGMFLLWPDRPSGRVVPPADEGACLTGRPDLLRSRAERLMADPEAQVFAFGIRRRGGLVVVPSEALVEPDVAGLRLGIASDSDGVAIGVRVASRIDAGTLPAALGFRFDDVVSEVDGMPLRTPADAARMREHLAQAEAVCVKRLRDDRWQTLHFVRW